MSNLKIVTSVATADIKLVPIKGDPRKVNGKTIEMKSDGSPKIIYKDPTKKHELTYAEVDTASGALLQAGRTSCYVAPDGTRYTKSDIVPHYVVMSDDDSVELIEAAKNDKTEVFEVKKWEPIEHYLDMYQMDRYYQVVPSSGLSKKDFAKKQAVQSNTVELKKLWDYMHKEKVVGRGRLNITSSGFLPSVGYLRAVDLGDKWTFEVAIFKENKPFTWSEAKDWTPTLNTNEPVVEHAHATVKVEVEDI